MGGQSRNTRAARSSVELDPHRFSPTTVRLSRHGARPLHGSASHALEHIETAADYLDPKNPAHAADLAFNREVAEHLCALVKRLEEVPR